MKNKSGNRLSALILFVFCTGFAFAEAEPADQIRLADVPYVYGERNFLERVEARAAGRTPVGLVLSSGSARAFAHIGVLRRMEELGIVPDFIVANSMGSIVGILYGAGFSPDQISEIIQSADIGALLKLVFPIGGGILDVGKLAGLLESYTGKIDISELPIPVMVLCEDLRTKRQVRIAEGDLTAVMQAAYALPGYFNPVEYRNHLLIDGGIANMVPLDVAYEYTDKVIASTAFYRNHDLNLRNPITNINVAIDIGKSRAGVSQIKKYNPLLIRCDVESFSFMDFDNIAEIQAAGYRSADEMSDGLSELDSAGVDEVLSAVRSANRKKMDSVRAAYRPLGSISVPSPRALVTASLDVFPYEGSLRYLNEDLHFTGGMDFSAGLFNAAVSAGAGTSLSELTRIFPVADASLSFDLFPTLRFSAEGSLRFGTNGVDYSDPAEMFNIFGRSDFFLGLYFVPLATANLRGGLLCSGELGTGTSFNPSASILTLQAEFEASSDPRSEENYTAGVVGGAQLYNEGSALGLDDASGFADLGFALPVPGTAGFLRLDGRGFVRYPITGLNTRYYLRDGMRTSLETGDVPNVNFTSADLVLNFYGFRPAFAELFQFKEVELSVFGNVGMVDGFLWSSGLDLSLDLSLIGLKPVSLDTWIAWDSLSGGLAGGLMIIP